MQQQQQPDFTVSSHSSLLLIFYFSLNSTTASAYMYQYILGERNIKNRKQKLVLKKNGDFIWP